MSIIHDPADRADPAVRAAVDAVLADTPGSALARAALSRIAQGLRAEHPADWERRLQQLWALALQMGELWSPADERRGLERLLVTLTTEQPRTVAASPAERLEALAAAEGVQPIDDPASLVFTDWPDDEGADDFIAAVREWRRDTPPAP